MKLPIIVATSSDKNDDDIEKIAKTCNVECFRGSKNDVLDRFYNAAKKYSLKYIFRITGDCPLIDPKQSIKVLEEIKSNNFDYVKLDDNSYPDGLDTEIFTFNALEKAWNNAKLKSEREHVTPFMYDPQNNFKIKKIPYEKNYSNLRWTVDYEDDLEFVKKIYSVLYYKQIFFMEDILKLLEKMPELKKINSSHSRNEGYAKSLKENKLI
tara:strand:- start:41 stop:670 length:630 start_codon:yes stop_codon:yes gene_type:complete